jgi:hypothetical protein
MQLSPKGDKGEIIGQKKLPGNGEAVEFLREFDKGNLTS